MIKAVTVIFFIVISVFQELRAQIVSPQTDSFFLSGKKGILGRLARSISRNGDFIEPIKTVDPYKKFQGRIIRSISISSVGFNYSLNDTVPVKNSLPVRIANGLHKNTFDAVIRKNLFLRTGTRFYPLVAADNERFLRNQPFLQDALIVVTPSVYSNDSVDVIVLTRDVFSIGGDMDANLFKSGKAAVKEENFGGSGNKVTLFGLYDKDRLPTTGIGGEILLRNIKGSFINWTHGFKTFNPTFNSGRPEEIFIYSKIEKPMASRYTAVTGAAELSYHSTINGYLTDSLYSNEFRYRYYVTDVWAGFNIGYNRGRKQDSENYLRHFLAARTFSNNFTKVPVKYISEYNYRYADVKGVLLSYTLYRQNFYRTNFIYAFGRNEDVPQGINATLIGGYINKQGVKRAYYGFEMEGSLFNKKEGFFSYTLRTGGYVNNRKFQDVDILVGLDHFTKLFTISKFWFNRSFMGISYSRQLNTYLNEPLLLQSDFGLPFFRNADIVGVRRATFNAETVFYNTKKIFGFRFAPFAFGDLSLIQPVNESVSKTNGYPAIGGGIRTRNENLIFGTVELKGFIFPRVVDGMKNWKVELSTKLLFKYNSTFIRRPDFVRPN